ncbi:MAG: hypothetical protein IJC37_04835 [Clostridia bacterium]|nr:hypothetical protein [Clostridia bacterium]
MKIGETLRKIPFGILSLCCLGFTYLVASTVGMLVFPVIMCIVFVLPLGITFAILDIVIRRKKLIPIISLALSLYPIIGFTVIIFNLLRGFAEQLIAHFV